MIKRRYTQPASTESQKGSGFRKSDERKDEITNTSNTTTAVVDIFILFFSIPDSPSQFVVYIWISGLCAYFNGSGRCLYWDVDVCLLRNKKLYFYKNRGRSSTKNNEKKYSQLFFVHLKRFVFVARFGARRWCGAKRRVYGGNDKIIWLLFKASLFSVSHENESKN